MNGEEFYLEMNRNWSKIDELLHFKSFGTSIVVIVTLNICVIVMILRIKAYIFIS